MPVQVRRRLELAQRRLREVRDRREDSGNRRGRSYAFTSLTPIRPGGAPAVQLALQSYEKGPSPFRGLPEVHCARLVVIEQLKTGWFGVPEPRPQLNSQYVLFTADVIAPYDAYTLPDRFLQRLYIALRPAVDAVWGRCYGFPTAGGAAEFAEWLVKSQLDTSLYFVGYPEATPQEVRDALRVRDELIEFVRTHQHVNDWDRTRTEYLTRGYRWFRSS
jgi:hypothetical protein